jgi:hypothetical protein
MTIAAPIRSGRPLHRRYGPFAGDASAGPVQRLSRRASESTGRMSVGAPRRTLDRAFADAIRAKARGLHFAEQRGPNAR